MTLSLASTHTQWISSAVKDSAQREEKAELALTWKCVVGIGFFLWARTPLMRGKNVQKKADLTHTMPVILSNMNQLPSNTNKYCSNTSGSLRLALGEESDGGSELHTSHPASHYLLNPTPRTHTRYPWPLTFQIGSLLSSHFISVMGGVWSCWCWFSNSISPKRQQELKWG